MSYELKPCPFCGSEATYMYMEDGIKYVQCNNRECDSMEWLRDEVWNTRPLEDELRKKIADLRSGWDIVMLEKERDALRAELESTKLKLEVEQ